MDHMGFLEKLESMSLIELEEPATDREISDVQDSLQFALPEDVATFFQRTNGLNAFGGSFRVNPILSGDGYNLRDASNTYRESQWPIPLEMIVFGDDGTGSPYGFWRNLETVSSFPVVLMGEIFEERSMTVCALAFSDFVCAQLSIGVLIENRKNFELVKSYIPFGSNARTASDDELAQLVALAVSPELADLHFDPYQDKLDKYDIDNKIRLVGRK